MNLNNLNLNLDTLSEKEIDNLYFDLLPYAEIKLKSWAPHDKQKAFQTSLAKGRVILGGNQSGKTEVGTLEAIYHATGLYPEWYPKEGRSPVPSTGRIVVSDFGKGFASVLKPKLERWLPPGALKEIRRNHEGWPERYYLKNGS